MVGMRVATTLLLVGCWGAANATPLFTPFEFNDPPIFFTTPATPHGFDATTRFFESHHESFEGDLPDGTRVATPGALSFQASLASDGTVLSGTASWTGAIPAAGLGAPVLLMTGNIIGVKVVDVTDLTGQLNDFILQVLIETTFARPELGLDGLVGWQQLAPFFTGTRDAGIEFIANQYSRDWNLAFTSFGDLFNVAVDEPPTLYLLIAICLLGAIKRRFASWRGN